MDDKQKCLFLSVDGSVESVMVPVDSTDESIKNFISPTVAYVVARIAGKWMCVVFEAEAQFKLDIGRYNPIASIFLHSVLVASPCVHMAVMGNCVILGLDRTTMKTQDIDDSTEQFLMGVGR